MDCPPNAIFVVLLDDTHAPYCGQYEFVQDCGHNDKTGEIAIPIAHENPLS
jgi:hypothetical protein